eukprot:TRINITY_DN553_c0_g1_i12.p1 TRINITY_DN553_c0_g1~~TRINITY_DN553_c0_g1_i12.p1  ORF type:complete len:511 (-),score=43.80 TRINITY_DN553_c0_g1_i12:299-1633(-)
MRDKYSSNTNFRNDSSFEEQGQITINSRSQTPGIGALTKLSQLRQPQYQQRQRLCQKQQRQQQQQQQKQKQLQQLFKLPIMKLRNLYQQKEIFTNGSDIGVMSPISNLDENKRINVENQPIDDKMDQNSDRLFEKEEQKENINYLQLGNYGKICERSNQVQQSVIKQERKTSCEYLGDVFVKSQRTRDLLCISLTNSDFDFLGLNENNNQLNIPSQGQNRTKKLEQDTNEIRGYQDRQTCEVRGGDQDNLFEFENPLFYPQKNVFCSNIEDSKCSTNTTKFQTNSTKLRSIQRQEVAIDEICKNQHNRNQQQQEQNYQKTGIQNDVGSRRESVEKMLDTTKDFLIDTLDEIVGQGFDLWVSSTGQNLEGNQGGFDTCAKVVSRFELYNTWRLFRAAYAFLQLQGNENNQRNAELMAMKNKSVKLEEEIQYLRGKLQAVKKICEE